MTSESSIGLAETTEKLGSVLLGVSASKSEAKAGTPEKFCSACGKSGTNLKKCRACMCLYIIVTLLVKRIIERSTN